MNALSSRMFSKDILLNRKGNSSVSSFAPIDIDLCFSGNTKRENLITRTRSSLSEHFEMPRRAERTSKAHSSSRSTISSNQYDDSKFSIVVWFFRIILSIILILFIMPIALLLTPWWIWLQPFETKYPDMIDGYYRIVTWPLTMSKKIRSYRSDDHFPERLQY